MCKHKDWHDQIIDRARRRKPLGCYKETHHIIPRSLGGDNGQGNLVDLTYREHFLVHWLLTKIHVGADLRRMQRALLAMLLQVSPGRDIQTWQMNAAKRAVRDLAVDPIQDAEWRRNYTLIALQKEDAKRSRDALRLRERGKLRQEARDRLEQAVNGDKKLSKSELKLLTDQLLKRSKSVKYAFRPRRMIGPDGTVRNRQKIQLNHPEFYRSSGTSD